MAKKPAATPETSAFLLAWNPERWAWQDLDSQIGKLAAHGSFKDRWSCGNTRAIPAGAQFYLLKVGRFGRGIIGGGRTIGFPFPKVNRRGVGRLSYFAELPGAYEAQVVDVRFEFLSHDPLVHWHELHRPPFDTFRWGFQKSGVRLHETLVGPLKRLVESRLTADVRAAEEISEIYHEGAKRTVVVNAYERNRAARAQCIASHGTACSVCDVRLGDVYGTIAAGYIHVHHLVPVSARGEYVVDPVRDLRPICPNCHAVAHLADPPLAIAELRRLLGRDE